MILSKLVTGGIFHGQENFVSWWGCAPLYPTPGPATDYCIIKTYSFTASITIWTWCSSHWRRSIQNTARVQHF